MKIPQLEISTDNQKLDIDYITNFLSKSYWAEGRTSAQVKQSIAHSIAYGVYRNGKQIGFARVLTDKVVFAYLMDIFIDENHRGKGYATLLLGNILQNPEFSLVENWYLKTKDAHALYEKVGFQKITDPEQFMNLKKGKK